MTAMRAIAGLFTVMFLLMSCTREPVQCAGSDNTAAVVDPALLAFLSRARSAHHMADTQESEHPEQAIQTLLAVLRGPVPGNEQHRPPEIREVLADTATRVADLQSLAQQFDAAERWLEQAKPWVPEMSYFRGHLFEVQGLVHERRAAWYESQGQSPLAAQARKNALTAFEESMNIQEQVIRSSSADAGKGR